MSTDLSSRDRTLAALNHQEADRVPVFFRGVQPFEQAAPGMSWRQRVDDLLAKGVDAKVSIGIGPRVHPDVIVRDWTDDDSDPDYRLACRAYDTPAGTLQARMRCTGDCAYPDGVPLTGDHNVSRGVEFFVKGRDDLPKLAYLLQEPGAEEIADFRERARAHKQFAADRGLLLEASGGAGGDLGLYLCGPDLILRVVDDPDFGQELMEMSYRIDLKCMEIALDEEVDVIDARGCYETAPLWSPRWFDELFAPRLKRKVDLAQQAGAKFSYFSSGEFLPHTDTLLRVGVDAINCVRPVADRPGEVRRLKERLGGRICLWGGVNPEEDIEYAAPAHIRRTVIDVILDAAPGGGLVLAPGGSLYHPDKYDNVMTFIEAALALGTYPIDRPRLTEQRERLGADDG